MTNLKSFELVFCDNSKAIKFAWNKGLSKNIPIITNSPFLCLSKLYKTKSFNNYFKGTLPNFGKHIKEVCLEIEKDLEIKMPSINDELNNLIDNLSQRNAI